MLPDLCVRPAVMADREALAALVENIDLESLSSGQIVVEQTFIAVQVDTLVGFVTWAQDEMQAVIVGLGVREDRRRFGVATMLLNDVAEYLREGGLRLVEVTVNAAEPGPRAVLSLSGFRQIGTYANGDIHFERRLWGRRNRGDGFA